jgi:putative ABC transport system ATP-binding protein
LTLMDARTIGDGALIQCDNLVKIYKIADLEVVALQGLDLVVEPGEFTALVGASGSGKSTLMNILGGLDVPSAGRAVVAGHVLGQMGRKERTNDRRRAVGLVWQQTSRNLLPYLTAAENVAMARSVAGTRSTAGEVDALLALLDVGHCRDRTPGRLSGGEQQRVAIAVVLTNEPRVLLADEPTGELDERTSADVLEAMRAVNAELGVTILIVTHDPTVSEQCAAHRAESARWPRSAQCRARMAG